MPLNSIEEIIADIRVGKPVILMDDESRENEGDLIVAAEKVTPEIINFMVTKARGLVCLTLTEERCKHLGLTPMAVANRGAYETPFMVSIEAAKGVTTGISAADRAKTIEAAVSAESKSEDVVQPGHIFPLQAQPGGVLSRAGHTEAGCDLTKLAGLTPAAAIIEIMNEDGSMARRPELELFAKEHGLKIGSIADLIDYRMANERTIKRLNQKQIANEYGQFTATFYEDTVRGEKHLALSMGQWQESEPVLVRVQCLDYLRDLLQVHKPGNTSWSVTDAMTKVAKAGKGVIVLLDADRLSANKSLAGYDEPKVEKRDQAMPYLTVGTGSQILLDLGVRKMRLLSPLLQFGALPAFGLEVVEMIPFSGTDRNS